MVVEVVDINSIAVVEAKCHSPVPGDRDRIVPLQTALQRVQPETRNIHPFRARTSIKGGEDAQELRDVSLTYP